MAKKTQAEMRGYLLPEDINPPQVSICICIPCDRNHALAFLGQLNDLGYWWTWERDSEKRGTLAAQVWREIYDDVNRQLNDCGVFDMSCGCESNEIIRRFIGDDGLLYVEYEDGTIETREPDDPRFSNPVLPPPPGEDGAVKKCIAANSIVTALQELQQDEYAAMADGTNLLNVLFTIIAGAVGVWIGVPVIGLPGFIILVITQLINYLSQQIPADWNDEFTEQVWQDFLCILYCTMDDDGSFSESQWQVVKARVNQDITAFYPNDFFIKHLDLVGAVGLTNMARLGYGGSRDCSECDCEETWCYEWDFEDSLQGWAIVNNTGGSVPFGVWQPGHVSYGDARSPATNGAYWRGAVIQRSDFDGAIVTKLTITIESVKGLDTAAGDPLIQFVAINGNNVIWQRNYSNMVEGSPVDVIVEGIWTVTQLNIDFRSSATSAASGYSGDIKILHVRAEGEGVNPFGMNICGEE